MQQWQYLHLKIDKIRDILQENGYFLSSSTHVCRLAQYMHDSEKYLCSRKLVAGIFQLFLMEPHMWLKPLSLFRR
jgi:hypothetical protein